MFSRDKIGVEQLQNLKERFEDDLNEREFVDLFREIIDATLSETQLTHLFQKIDSNSDGTVDWDEFTNFMFLASSDQMGGGEADATPLYVTRKEDETDDGTLPAGSALRPFQHHKDSITSISYLDKTNHYATSSKDGTVRIWNASNLAFQNTLISTNSWIADCAYMSRYNRLAIASMDRKIKFYDASTGQSLGYIQDTTKTQCTGLSLAYVKPTGDTPEVLVVGQDTGVVNVYKCSDAWATCDGRAGGNTIQSNCFSWKSAFAKHTDWITKVGYVNDLRCIVAASLDKTISVIDLERLTTKFEFTRHKKGVYDFCWSASTRMIASCGLERDIYIWNPYSSQRAVASLRGHTASVCHIVCDDDNQQLISVSSDNILKVWDVRNHQCLQTFSDKASLSQGESKISALFFDAKGQKLVAGKNHLVSWPLRKKIDEKRCNTRRDYSAASSIACYNPLFNQVVTAKVDAEENVYTWNAETGEEICRFANAHGSSPITAMIFDTPGRRLLTGSHKGSQLNMWNFSNGALVKEFFRSQRPEEPKVRYGTFRPREIALLPEGYGYVQQEDEHVIPNVSKVTLGRLKPASPATGPATADLSHHDDNEITCILDIENTIRRNLGEFITQRFVCCAGWDKKISVWMDKNGEDQADPLYTVPIDGSPHRHTRDITNLVYIPPAYFASGALDGKVILWNLNSGEHIATLCATDATIEAMTYSSKLEILFASGDDGILHLFNRTLEAVAEIRLRHAPEASIVIIHCDDAGDNFATGDSTGQVKIWRIVAASDESGFYIEPLNKWRFGTSRITSLDFIESDRLIEKYLLLATGNGDATIWTLDGVHIGTFGSGLTWQLGVISSYAEKQSSASNEHQIWSKQMRYFVPTKRVLKDNPAHTLIAERLPKRGEVWIRVSSYLSRKNASTKIAESNNKRRSSAKMDSQELMRKAANPFEIIDVITIIRVSKGELVAWDGNTAKPFERSIDLQEFNTLGTWAKHDHLTQFIGRMFLCAETSKPFKVMCMGIKSIELRGAIDGTFFFTDTNRKRHAIQRLQDAVAAGSTRLRRIARSVILGAGFSNILKKQQGNPRVSSIIPGQGVLSGTTSSSIKRRRSSLMRSRKIAAAPPVLPYPTIGRLQLPETTPRMKHIIGGVVPKRSALRNKHDASMDFRRVHDLAEVPKNLKEAMKFVRQARLKNSKHLDWSESRMASII